MRRHRYAATVRLPRNDNRRASLTQAAHPVIEEKSQQPVWLSLLCPCRCGTILRINLMRSQSPVWSVSMDDKQRFTVSPSIDVPACRSHFWIRSGRVHWVWCATWRAISAHASIISPPRSC